MTCSELPILSSDQLVLVRRLTDKLTARQKSAKVDRMRAIEAQQNRKKAEALL